MQRSKWQSYRDVGALPQEQRHVEAERLGGFQIDHQLELVRSLDGELARFCALEDASA